MKNPRALLQRISKWTDFGAIFTIDLRSLALVRILTALILLADLITRLPDLVMFYGDQSVLPTSLLNTFAAGNWWWSVHVFAGSTPAYTALIFGIEIIAALFLLLGYWARISSIVSWFLLVSLHNGNPLILLGGDFLLRQTMFVGMFIPWGELFSLDRYLSKKPIQRIQITSVWGAVFLIQLAFMYYFASLYKNSIEWNVDGSAFYYILSIDQYVTPLGHLLLQFPGTLRFLTLGVVVFQHWVIFLLFIPFLNKYIRTATAGTLMLMHLCFGIGTYLGIFSWISMTALVAFMPEMVWSWCIATLARFHNRIATTIRRWIDITVSHDGAIKKKKTLGFGAVSLAVLGVIYISYLFLWQAVEFAPVLRGNLMWNSWTIPGRALRLDQHWNLFTPHPYTDDGWDIVEGHLKDGSVVDVFRDGAPLTWEKPTNVYAIYKRSHIREYTLGFRKTSKMLYRQYYAKYICSSWNASHDASQRLESLEYFFMLEETPRPGDPQSPVVPLSLIKWTCEQS